MVRTSLGQGQFIVQSDKDLGGHATRIDWKQVFLSDFVFCQKLKLLSVAVRHHNPNSTHNQSVGLGKAARQSFFSLLMQNQSGLNNRRRSLAEVDKRSELDFENRPLYTQIFWKVPKKSCDLCHIQDVIS